MNNRPWKKAAAPAAFCLLNGTRRKAASAPETLLDKALLGLIDRFVFALPHMLLQVRNSHMAMVYVWCVGHRLCEPKEHCMPAVVKSMNLTGWINCLLLGGRKQERTD